LPPPGGNTSVDLPEDNLRNATIPTRLSYYRRKVGLQTSHINHKVCVLCGKQNDEWHERSKTHVERIEEAAMITALAGEPGWVNVRRHLSSVVGKALITSPSKPLCKEAVREWWGREIELLPTRAAEVLAQKGVLLDGKAKKKVAIQGTPRLAMIAYNGIGKHHEKTKCVPWDAVPGTPQDVGSDIPRGRSGRDFRDWVAQDELDELGAPDAWWPVVILADAPTDEGIQLLVSWGGVIYVVCIYQVWWDAPGAWRVTMTPLRRRARL
jgi:hypothetical protein